MKRIDIMRRAGRNLSQAKIRTLLTALAISVGAFTITLALAAGTGGKIYTDELISNNGDTRSLTVFPSGPSREDTAPQKYGEETASQQLLVQKDIDRIAKVDGVESVTPLYNVSVTYMSGPNDTKYQTSLRIKADQTNVPLEAGSLDNSQPDDGKAIVSKEYIEALGFDSPADAIGGVITLHVDQQTITGKPAAGKDVQFTIQAVDKKSETALNYQEGVRINPVDGKALYEYQTAPLKGAANQYYGVTVRAKAEADPSKVQTAIKDLGYQVFSLQDVQAVLFTFVNVVMGGAAGFGALAIIASVFGIINTQYISVLERTQQIGLMKALGARRKDVGKLFRYEAAWVGFLGGLIGTVAAFVMGVFNPLITDKLGLEEGTRLLVFNPLYSVILIVGLMVIAVLAGWFPSRKAAKLDPIEALRTE